MLTNAIHGDSIAACFINCSGSAAKRPAPTRRGTGARNALQIQIWTALIACFEQQKCQSQRGNRLQGREMP